MSFYTRNEGTFLAFMGTQVLSSRGPCSSVPFLVTFAKANCPILATALASEGCATNDFLGLSLSHPSLQLCMPNAGTAPLPTEMTSGQGNARLEAGFD